MTTQTVEVFYEERNGKLFLCIPTPDGTDLASLRRASETRYNVEREIVPMDEAEMAIQVRTLIAEMAAESGLNLIPCPILKSLGV